MNDGYFTGRQKYGLNHAELADVGDPNTPTKLGAGGIEGREATPSGSPGSWSQESEDGRPGLRHYVGENTEVTAPAVNATAEEVSGRSIGTAGGLGFEANNGHVTDLTNNHGLSGGVASVSDQNKYNHTAAVMSKESGGKGGYRSFKPNSSEQDPRVLNRIAADEGTSSSVAMKISNDASDNEPSKTFDVSANAKGNYPIPPNSAAADYARSQQGGSNENLKKLSPQDELRARTRKPIPTERGE